MDFLKLIQSLQDLVYEIVVWALLLPKTLLRVIFRPRKMVDYVNQEWKKETEKQFDEYLSPTLFFLLVGTLPGAFFTWVSGLEGIPAQLTENNLLVSMLTTLASLLISLIWLEWLNKRVLKRSSLKRLFLIQCYLATSAQFIYVLALFSINFLGISTVTITGVLVTVFYEAFAFQDELKVNWWKGFGYAAAPYIAIFVISFVVMATLAFVFHITPDVYLPV